MQAAGRCLEGLWSVENADNAVAAQGSHPDRCGSLAFLSAHQAPGVAPLCCGRVLMASCACPVALAQKAADAGPELAQSLCWRLLCTFGELSTGPYKSQWSGPDVGTEVPQNDRRHGTGHFVSQEVYVWQNKTFLVFTRKNIIVTVLVDLSFLDNGVTIISGGGGSGEDGGGVEEDSVEVDGGEDGGGVEDGGEEDGGSCEGSGGGEGGGEGEGGGGDEDDSVVVKVVVVVKMMKSTKGSVVLGHVFRHVNLAEIDYFGLRYCDRSHQTTTLKTPDKVSPDDSLHVFSFLCRKMSHLSLDSSPCLMNLCVLCAVLHAECRRQAPHPRALAASSSLLRHAYRSSVAR
ncbi:Band 4.1-like protein 4A [Tupaia chinensis]|uniref:Band 4.1-like protein 4A n=1 Tax=Tupaia chinensis TaxID=246437 RepID=L9L1W9_TUPCH|nr:Band 4.1-like protein 4A [Tupaia chinensis]